MFPALRWEELPVGEGPGRQIRRVRAGAGHGRLARLVDGTVIAFAPRSAQEPNLSPPATTPPWRPPPGIPWRRRSRTSPRLSAGYAGPNSPATARTYTVRVGA